MESKRVFITGVTGQDGSYLAELLITKGYDVHALVRRSSRDPFERIGSIKHQVTMHYGDLRDLGALDRVITSVNPHEIYNLAAQSDVGISFKCPEETYEINYAGVGRLVHTAMNHNPGIRIYQASTSEMFGSTQPPQNEQSEFNPVSPYGKAKRDAHEDYVRSYREKHGLFICAGILFNHESPRRGEHFVTRKITLSLAKIIAGAQEEFSLGNLNATRDWGFAGDYVEAMWKMLQRDKPQDFVIAMGESHSVREFVIAASNAMGMPLTFEGTGLEEVGIDRAGKVRIRINPEFYRPNEVHNLQGDPSKAREVLGWKPKTSFTELVEMMAIADKKLIEDRQRSGLSV